ncbi:MAG: Crp/Fnr family transcriptional regulator [Proteobacteria bacterium]|nr:Crp/Fnr family transcriptional regulator [Pseudomonadota bacterium]
MTPSTARKIDSFLRPGDCAAWPARRFAAYSDLPAGALKFLQAARAGERVLSPNSNIYWEEKAVDEVFTVYDGLAFAYKLLPDGRRQILDFLLPGSFIGLHALWFKAMPHSVQTLTEVSLCVFDKEKFGDLLRRKPKYEWQLLRYSASCQANSNERLLDLGRRTARERIARLVLDFHDHLASRAMVGEAFPFHLRQEHIADALGLTRGHVSNILRGLRHEGLLEVNHQTAKVLDLRGLRELAIYTESRSQECL